MEEESAATSSTTETLEGQTARLRKFVFDYCDGKIVTDRQYRTPEQAMHAFMVLSFLDPKDLPKDTALVYEYANEARAGFFWSCRFLTHAEAARVWPAINSELARRKVLEDAEAERRKQIDV